MACSGSTVSASAPGRPARVSRLDRRPVRSTPSCRSTEIRLVTTPMSVPSTVRDDRYTNGWRGFDGSPRLGPSTDQRHRLGRSVGWVDTEAARVTSGLRIGEQLNCVAHARLAAAAKVAVAVNSPAASAGRPSITRTPDSPDRRRTPGRPGRHPNRRSSGLRTRTSPTTPRPRRQLGDRTGQGRAVSLGDECVVRQRRGGHEAMQGRWPFDGAPAASASTVATARATSTTDSAVARGAARRRRTTRNSTARIRRVNTTIGTPPASQRPLTRWCWHHPVGLLQAQ